MENIKERLGTYDRNHAFLFWLNILQDLCRETWCFSVGLIMAKLKDRRQQLQIVSTTLVSEEK